MKEIEDYRAGRKAVEIPKEEKEKPQNDTEE
jgi:hypothetical protein